MLGHDLEAQCQIKAFRGKLGGDERSVPPSYTPTTTCTQSHSPSPFSGPVTVSQLGWGHPVSYKPARIQLLLGTSSVVRLWQAKALLEYILFYFYSHHWQPSLAPNTQRWRWEPSCPHPGKDMKMLFLLTFREMEVLLKTARHEPELLKEWAGALLRLNLYARRQRHCQEPTPCTLSLSYRGRSRVHRTCPVTQSENKDWHQSCSDPGLTNLKAKLWKPILWPWAHMAALTHGAITGLRLSNSVQPASIFLTGMFICFGFLHLPHYSTNSKRLVCISNIVLGTL